MEIIQQLLRETKKRLQLCWHVLRGRPLIYNVKFVGGIELNASETKDLLCEDISIEGTGTEVGITFHTANEGKEFIKACLDIADQILAIPNLAILHPEQNHPLVTNPQEVDIATAYAHRMYKQGFRRVIL